jgi:hypothetical protein
LKEKVAVPIYKKLTLTSPTSGGCFVGIVCSRTQATEFFFMYVCSTSIPSDSMTVVNFLEKEGLFHRYHVELTAGAYLSPSRYSRYSENIKSEHKAKHLQVDPEGF